MSCNSPAARGGVFTTEQASWLVQILLRAGLMVVSSLERTQGTYKEGSGEPALRPCCVRVKPARQPRVARGRYFESLPGFLARRLRLSQSRLLILLPVENLVTAY